MGNVPQSNVMLSFGITRTIVSFGTYTDTYPSTPYIYKMHETTTFNSFETKLNDDKLSETATCLLRPKVIVSYILEIHNGHFYWLLSPVVIELSLSARYLILLRKLQ